MRSSIIKNGPKDLIDTLCECVHNLLKGNVKLNDSEKSKLAKYKNSMRKILSRISLKERKKILIQKGGLLEILLPSVISGLASIISSVISKE
jgi:hypothetical protein